MSCQKQTSNALLYVTQGAGRNAAQGSLDSHQIREKQQPSSSGKALQPKEQQLGGCPPPSLGQRCPESRAATHSLYPGRGKKVPGGLST